MKRLTLLLAFLATLLLFGCDTFNRRAQEKASTFERLSPEEREKLKRGEIAVGNSPDMVYIALGRPDAKRESSTAQGHEMVWTYNTYHREFEGNVHTGYRRFVVWNPQIKRYVVFYQPVYADVYSEHEEENIRVKFVDGKVTEIEQPKPPAGKK